MKWTDLCRGVDLGEMKTLNARIQPPGRGSLGYEFAPEKMAVVDFERV